VLSSPVDEAGARSVDLNGEELADPTHTMNHDTCNEDVAYDGTSSPKLIPVQSTEFGHGKTAK